MIDSQQGAQHRVGYNHFLSNKRKCNCFIKNGHEKSLNPSDFVIFSSPSDDTLTIFVRHGIMAHIPWPLNQSKLWNCVIP